MILPIRLQTRQEHSLSFTAVHELHLDPEQTTGGLPWLHGELAMAVTRPFTLLLRVHNQAGIPIVEGQSQVQAGQQQFTFSELRALGIEAYAHKPEAERIQVASRIWSRRAYGTLTVLAKA